MNWLLLQLKAQALHGSTTNAKLSELHKHGPCPFKGDLGEDKANAWLRDVEKAFNFIECNDEDKVRHATHMLRGEVDIWWSTERTVLYARGVEITQAQFVKAFNAQYFLVIVCSLKMPEFLALTQDNIKVGKHERNFTSLSCFAPRMVASPEQKAVLFEKGMLSFRSQVSMFQLTTYPEVVGKAVKVEKVVKELGQLSLENKYENGSKPNGKEPTTSKRFKSHIGKPRPPQPTSKTSDSSSSVFCKFCRDASHISTKCPQG